MHTRIDTNMLMEPYHSKNTKRKKKKEKGLVEATVFKTLLRQHSNSSDYHENEIIIL